MYHRVALPFRGSARFFAKPGQLAAGLYKEGENSAYYDISSCGSSVVGNVNIDGNWLFLEVLQEVMNVYSEFLSGFEVHVLD